MGAATWVPPEDAWMRGCCGKQKYPSEAGAEAGLRYLQGEGLLRTGEGLNPYLCPFCGDWHLGHVGGVR